MQIAISNDMSFKYAMQHPIPKVGDPVINIIDFTNEYSFIMGNSEPIDERTNFVKNFFDQNYPIVEGSIANITDSGSRVDVTLSYGF